MNFFPQCLFWETSFKNPPQSKLQLCVCFTSWDSVSCPCLSGTSTVILRHHCCLFTTAQFPQQVSCIQQSCKVTNLMTNQHCRCCFQVAIIIPFRHRENHLKYWLHYLHPILRRQKIDYGIYIINQVWEAASCVVLAKVTAKWGSVVLLWVAMTDIHGSVTQQIQDVRHVSKPSEPSGNVGGCVHISMIGGWLTSDHSQTP